MKFFAAVVAICLLCQAAAAQTPDCKSVSNPGARLACYDKAAPPAASSATGHRGRRALFQFSKPTATAQNM